MIRKRLLSLLAAGAAVLGVTAVAAPSAQAATLGMTTATVSELTFSYTCSTDTAGRLVARSWRYTNWTADSGQDNSAVVGAGGTVTQTRTLPASEAGLVYAARCLLYDTTSGALIVRTPATPQLIQVGYDVMFGSSVGMNSGETFAQAVTRISSQINPEVWRIFWTGLPSTNCADKKNVVDGEATVQSFKADPAAVAAGTYDSLLNTWMACFTKPTRVTVYHEPEDQIANGTFTAAEYVAAENHLADLAHAHSNAANLVPVQILMDWTLDAKSGRDWHTYYASHVDEMVWDVYNFPNTACSDPNVFSNHVANRDFTAVSAETGKPWGIGELGEPIDGLSCRPQLLQQVVDFARSNGGTFVTYFNNLFGSIDYRLSDAASQQVWLDAALS